MRADEKRAITTKRLFKTLSQARQYVTAGKYQKAIDFYKAEYKRHPQDRELVKEYVKSLEEIKTAADRALGREDFAYCRQNLQCSIEELSGL